MFVKKVQNTQSKLDQRLRPYLFTALAAQVDDLGIRIKEILPAGLFETKAPVGLLGVHKKVFIHQANLLDSFSAYQHKTTGDHIDLSDIISLPPRHSFPAKKAAVREDFIEIARR